MSNEALSPQEALRQQKAIDQLNEHWKQTLRKIGDDVALRKWCVEQANSPHASMGAQAIFAFITEPLRSESER